MGTKTELAGLILELVEQIPPGRVTTYGTLALSVKMMTGKGSARYVGTVLSRSGGSVPWWRVVNARGELVPHLRQKQRDLLLSEGVRMDPANDWRVAEAGPYWEPEEAA